MKRLGTVGLVIALVGLFLAVAYWPLTSTNGPQLLASESNGGFAGYPAGAKVTIHEKILNVSYYPFFGIQGTVLWMSTGDPNRPLPVLVEGDARGVVTPGEIVYMPAVLEQTFGGYEYWQVSTPSDVHPAWPLDYAFYGALGLGVAFVVADAIRARHGAPQG